MEKIVIYGNGKIAKIAYSFLSKVYDIVAFTVDKKVINEKTIFNLPVTDFENVEKKYNPQKYKMILAVGYHEMNKLRQRKFEEAKMKGYNFINYIHPSVEIHKDFEIGENNIILDHVSLQPFSKIGDNNIIWSGAVVAHGCIIEDNCWITSGVTIAGDSIIKSNCFIGINASIGHNIVVEKDNFIGANALVTKNTKEKEVYITSDSKIFRLDSDRFLKFTGGLI